MKKISRLAAVLVIGASFSVPFFASAQFDYACNPPCSANQFCNSNNVCVSNSTLTQQSTTGGVNLNVIKPYSDGIINLINGILVPVLMAIAFIVFLWGVYKYFILGAADPKSQEEGRQFVLWGIIGFVVILCVWGLVAIVTGTLNLTPGGKAPNTPTI